MKDKIIQILKNHADVLYTHDYYREIQIFGIDTKMFDSIANYIIELYENESDER